MMTADNSRVHDDAEQDHSTDTATGWALPTGLPVARRQPSQPPPKNTRDLGCHNFPYCYQDSVQDS